jgi:hypothetical protein
MASGLGTTKTDSVVGAKAAPPVTVALDASPVLVLSPVESPLHANGIVRHQAQFTGSMPILERAAFAAIETVPALDWIDAIEDRLSVDQRLDARRTNKLRRGRLRVCRDNRAPSLHDSGL